MADYVDVDAKNMALEFTKIYYKNLAALNLKNSISLENIIDTYNYALLKLNEGKQVVAAKPVAVKQVDVGKPLNQAAGIFSYINQKGVTYYLHQKGRLFYFSKDSANAINVPEGYFIKENTRTGLPFITKKK